MKFAQMDGDELVIVENGAGFNAPHCECTHAVDKVMRHYDVVLGSTWLNGARTPTLYVQRLIKDAPTVIVVPRFCPFCGVKYGAVAGAPPIDKLLALEERVVALEKFASQSN